MLERSHLHKERPRPEKGTMIARLEFRSLSGGKKAARTPQEGIGLDHTVEEGRKRILDGRGDAAPLTEKDSGTLNFLPKKSQGGGHFRKKRSASLPKVFLDAEKRAF